MTHVSTAAANASIDRESPSTRLIAGVTLRPGQLAFSVRRPLALRHESPCVSGKRFRHGSSSTGGNSA